MYRSVVEVTLPGADAKAANAQLDMLIDRIRAELASGNDVRVGVQASARATTEATPSGVRIIGIRD